MRFDGKVAMIVGAAQGIAKACAARMAGEGAIVIGVDRDTEALKAAIAEIAGTDGKAIAVVANALDETEVNKTVADTLAREGRIDILVNAVGGSTIIPNPAAHLDALSTDEWKALIDFNLLPTFLFCKAVIPVMKRQESGKIVNVSSYAHYGRGTGWSVGYAASKAGIVALTRKVAIEVGPFGINCNAIAPSRTLTDRIRRKMENAPGGTQDQSMPHVPLRRAATSEDQANVICFLASSDADYVTGVTIDVTGGQ